MNSFRTIFCHLLFVGSFLALLPAYAQIHTGYSALAAAHSGKCIDVYAGSVADGAPLIQYSCHNDDNQKWALQPFGSAYRVIARHSGQCMGVQDNSAQADAALVQQPCGSQSNQLWQLAASGEGYTLKSKETGMCAGVRAADRGDDAAVVQQPCLGQANEQWHFRAGLVLPGTPAAVVVRHSGQCLAMTDPLLTVGGKTAQVSCADNTAQSWQFIPLGDGYQVKLKGSGLCLGIPGASIKKLALAAQLACSDPGTRWNLQAGPQYYKLIAQHSGQCLEIKTGGMAENTAAVQNTCGTGINQRWMLRPPTTASALTPLINMPIVPVAAANLPNGKLLTWSAYSPLNFGADNQYGKTYTALFDPVTGTSQQRVVAETGHDMFCPGTSMLPNGSVLVNGGSSSQKTSIYNSASNTWSPAAPMIIARGYPGNTVLSDGSVLTLGGSWSGGEGGKVAEVWNAANGWKGLWQVPGEAFAGPDPGGIFRGDNHLWLFSLGNGIVLHAGPSAAMHWIDTKDGGDVMSAGNRADDVYSMNGNAVMYDIGKILKLGGAPAYEEAEATAASYVLEIDALLNTRKVAPMNFRRAMHNSVVLPNGQVVVMGGQSYVKLFSDERSILATELWDPQSETFIRLKPGQKPRNYHSVAILLPDGRVFSGGGGLCGDCTTNHTDAQILTPPYLLNADGTPATRPKILGAPVNVTHGGTLVVNTDSAIVSFALMRLSAVTHSVNNDQRRIPLEARSNDGRRYTLDIPNDPGSLTPGYYMLFAMNAKGVPSISHTVQITAGNAVAAVSRGEKLYRGVEAVRARLDGHADPLPPSVSQCINCHEATPAATTFAPLLTATSLLSATARRGAPAFAYDRDNFCETIQSGIDPQHVTLSKAMPRFDLNATQCAALWDYLSRRES